MTSAHPHPWQQLRLEWLWVYHGMVPVTETWSKDIVVPASVFFVMEGQGKIHADGKKLELAPGSAFLAAPGLRRQWFASDTQLLSVGFRALWPDGMPFASNGLNCVFPTDELKDLRANTKTLFRAIHPRKALVSYADALRVAPSNFPQWCKHEAAFRAWFASYAATLEQKGLLPTPTKQSADSRVQELVRRLEEWPVHLPLDAEQWTTDLSIGLRRAEQLLASQLGMTPHLYLNRRRLLLARSLLTNTSTPLKVIAHRIGLRHASHFTKWFRRHAGVVPSAYRTHQPGEGA